MEKGTFVEIDHTADIGLELAGPTPGAVLEAAQRGLMGLLLGDTSDLAPGVERRIALSAADYPDLLKAWCEELYRLLEEERFVALATRIESAEAADCRAVVTGARPAAERVLEASELKAVTYHQLAFAAGKPDAAGNRLWRARVIFDV